MSWFVHYLIHDLQRPKKKEQNDSAVYTLIISTLYLFQDPTEQSDPNLSSEKVKMSCILGE